VRAELIYGDADVELTVEDAGEGFDPKMVPNNGALGLLSMQERARSIGALFSIDSTIGEGTNIRVRVPVEGNGYFKAE
jgi:two-component system, NarL family, sensor histidine kinase NreB